MTKLNISNHSDSYEEDPIENNDLIENFLNSDSIPKLIKNRKIKLDKDWLDLLRLPYESYVHKIQTPYRTFKKNHNIGRVSNNFNNALNLSLDDLSLDGSRKSSNLKDISCFNIDMDMEIKNDEEFCNSLSRRESENRRFLIYKSNNELEDIVEEFNVNHLNKSFVINGKYFHTSIDVIQYNMKTLIDKGGLLDRELYRILKFSGRIYSYILSNMNIQDSVESACARIKRMKEKNSIVKRFFLENNSKQIKCQIKKRNIEKLKGFISILKKLKKSADCLETLSKNSSKYQLVYDLVNKSKDIMNKINTKSNGSLVKDSNAKLKCLEFFEQEFSKYTSKSSEKVIEELYKFLKDHFLANQLLHKSDIMQDLSFLIPYTDTNLDPLIGKTIFTSCLNYISCDFVSIEITSESKKSNDPKILKLNEMLTLIFKLDLDFFAKVKKLMTKLFKESIENIYERSISKIPSTIANNSSDEARFYYNQFLLVSLVRCFEVHMDSLASLSDYFCVRLSRFMTDNHSEDIYLNKKIEKFQKSYIEQFKDTEQALREEFQPVVNNIVEECLIGTSANIKIERFLHAEIKIREYSKVFKERIHESKKVFSHFCNNWFDYHQDILISETSKDDFNNLSSVPTDFNSKILQILNKELYNRDYNNQEILTVYDNLDTNLQENTKRSEENDTERVKFLIIGEKKFKILNSTLLYVETLFQFVKLLLRFPSNCETLVGQLYKVLKTISYMKKDLVLEAKGVGKNFSKVSQNHIIGLVSDLTFLRNFIESFQFTLSDRMKSDVLIDLNNEFLISLDSCIFDCKEEMLSLYRDK